MSSILDSIEPRSVSLKPLMPPIQKFKDFIVSMTLCDYSPVGSALWENIRPYLIAIQSVEYVRLIKIEDKGRRIGAKCKFKIRARCVTKEEFHFFLEYLFSIQEKLQYRTHSLDTIEIRIPADHNYTMVIYRTSSEQQRIRDYYNILFNKIFIE